jgi:streptomycin 6-kinase
LARQAAVVADAAALERTRLLQWIAAFAGLSVLWAAEDGRPAPGRLAVAALALAELGVEAY